MTIGNNSELISEDTEAKQEVNPDPCACITKMSDWIAKDDPEKECRPCLLAPVTQWYRDELQRTGFSSLAQELETLSENGLPLDIAQKLDTIKDSVPEMVKNRLRDFDCAAQLHKPGEE